MTRTRLKSVLPLLSSFVAAMGAWHAFAGDLTVEGDLLVDTNLTVRANATVNTNLVVGGTITAGSLTLSDGTRSKWYDKFGTVYETNFATDPFYAGSVWTNVSHTSWDSADGGNIAGSYYYTYDARARGWLGRQPYGAYLATFSVSNVAAGSYFKVIREGTEVASLYYVSAGSVTVGWTSDWDAVDFYHTTGTGGPIHWYDLVITCPQPLVTNMVSAPSVTAGQGRYDSLDVASLTAPTVKTTNVVAIAEGNPLLISTVDRSYQPSPALSGADLTLRSAAGGGTEYIPAGKGGNVLIQCGNGGHSVNSTEGEGGSLIVVPGTNGTDGTGTPGYSFFARRVYIGDTTLGLVSYLEYSSPTTVVIRGGFSPTDNSAFDLGTTAKRWKEIYGDKIYGDGSGLTGITGGGISNGSITTANLAANAVTGDKIADGSVSVAKLDTDSVDTRYVNQTGDTMTGSLSIQADLTVGGTVTLTYLPPQGDISMGVYTNQAP